MCGDQTENKGGKRAGGVRAEGKAAGLAVGV